MPEHTGLPPPGRRHRLRPHGASHYASLFRFDDLLLANTHAYGIWACHSPVLQLHKASSGKLFDFYASSFDGTWRRWGPGTNPATTATIPRTDQQPREESDMTDPETRLLDELDEHGILRRIEYVRARMHGWGLTTGDPGHIDVDDPTNSNPSIPLYIRARPSRPRRLLRPHQRRGRGTG